MAERLRESASGSGRIQSALMFGWPRLMKHETVAAYCDMTKEQFDRHCPVPAKDQGWRGLRWDRKMIDEWVDALPNKPGPESRALDGASPANDAAVTPQAELTAADRRRASLERL